MARARALVRYNLLKARLTENETFFATDDELQLEQIEPRRDALKTFVGDLTDAFVECAEGDVDLAEHQAFSTRYFQLETKMLTLIREKPVQPIVEAEIQPLPDDSFEAEPRRTSLEIYNRLKQQFEMHETFVNEAETGLSLNMLKLRLKAVQPMLEKIIYAFFDCAQGEVAADEHARLENRIYDLTESLQNEIDAKTPPMSQQPVIRDSTHREQSDVLRTPKLEIPKFDGKIENWPRYRDMFTSLVHNNAKLSDMMKFTYLESSFVIPPGQPNILKDFPLTAECYQTVWKAVCDRYNDKRRLIAHHMSAILSTKKMNCYNAAELLRVMSSFTSNLSALAENGFAIDDTQTVADMMFVHLLTSRLDDEVFREWRKHCIADVPKWKELTDYLAVLWRSCQDIEMKGPMISKPAESKELKSSRTFTASSAAESTGSGRCPLCEQSHGLWMCSSFEAMNNNDRWDAVKSNRLCFICLRKGHGVAACPNTNLKCKKCQKNHGDLLHHERPENSSQHSNESFAAVSQSNNLNPETNESNPQWATFTPLEMNKRQVAPTATFSAFASRHLRSKDGKGLLSTAIVLLEDADGRLQPVRTLLDTGGEDNHISERMARKLRLPTKSQFRHVEGIGTNAVVSKKKAFATMESRYGKYVRNLELDVLSRISGDYPTVPLDVKSLGIPANCFLADPTFGEANELDMILSNEICLETELTNKRKLKSGPYLKETMFGWTVGGRINDVPPLTIAMCSFSRSFRAHSDEVRVDEKLLSSEDQKLKKSLSTDEELKPVASTLSTNEKPFEELLEQPENVNWNAVQEKLELLNSACLDRRCLDDNHVTVESYGFKDATTMDYDAEEITSDLISLIRAKSRATLDNPEKSMILPGNDKLLCITTRQSHPKMMVKRVAWMRRFGAPEKCESSFNRTCLNVEELEPPELSATREESPLGEAGVFGPTNIRAK